MTELSALNVKITGDAGDLKAAVTSAKGDLAGLGAAAKAAGGQVATLGPRMAAAASGGGGFAQSMRGVSQQLSQVGQQTMATGNFVQSLAIQLPDLGLAFGAVGAAAGLLAGIALPLVVAAFTDTADNASALSGAIKELSEATEAFRISAQAIRLGVDEREVLLVEHMNELISKSIDLQSRLSETYGKARIPLEGQLRVLQDAVSEAEKQVDAYRRARDEAKLLEQQAILIKQQYAQYPTLLSQATKNANGLAIATANVAIEAQRAAAAMAAMAAYDASAAATGLAGPDGVRSQQQGGGRFTPRVSGAGLATPRVSGGGVGSSGGGGGGGAGRDFASELEAFQETLMTEVELEATQFAQRQTLLEEFLAAKVVSLQEYQSYTEEIKAEHEAKMGEIEAAAYQQRLSETAGLFGALASIAQVGGKKMARAVAVAQAIEGTINAYGAAIKALNTPGISLAGRFAAYASVLAAGLKGVSAIRSAGGVGGGGAAGGAVSAPAAAQQQGPMQVSLNTYGAGDMIRAADFGMILDRIGQEAGDRGYQLMWRPS